MPGKATHEEICDGALRHYRQISIEAGSWMNTVEKAIKFYRDYYSKYKKEQEMNEGKLTDFQGIDRLGVCEDECQYSKSHSEMVDWIDMWRTCCAHGGNKENCFNCYSRKECDKAIDEIRKTLRRKECVHPQNGLQKN